MRHDVALAAQEPATPRKPLTTARIVLAVLGIVGFGGFGIGSIVLLGSIVSTTPRQSEV